VTEASAASTNQLRRFELALRLVAPYLAVLVFWVGFHSAWLALLAYHAQILLWLRIRGWTPVGDVRLSLKSFAALPSVLAGPVVFFLLPAISRADIAEWLSSYGLSGWSLLLMVFYFGIVHPPLEQQHWSPLRSELPLLSHPTFAGYHVIVLHTLLPGVWLASTFAVLLVASVMWQQMERRTGGLTVPIASHIMADLGIVVTAVLLAWRPAV